MAYDNKETGKKKIVRKLLNFLQWWSPRSTKEKENYFHYLKKPKNNNNKKNLPAPVFHELCTIYHLSLTPSLLGTYVEREHDIDFLMFA